MSNNQLPDNHEDNQTERILILAPTGRDALMTANFLSEAGLSSDICENVQQLCQKMSENAGLIFLTGEALTVETMLKLVSALSAQPAWSDLPLIVLTNGGGETPANVETLNALSVAGNVTLIERPVRLMTLMSTVKSALRARRRQYDIRDYIIEEKRTAAKLEKLFESERAARSLAETASLLKDEFLATVSHELRTPLNAIVGWTNLLRSGRLEAGKVAHALEVIQRNARSQAKIIEDLLDVSRIITGKLKLEIESVDVASLIKSVIESVMPAAEANEITVRQTILAEDTSIVGDAARLQQVLWNLLTNSIKFTERGGQVEVKLQRTDLNLVISVSDNGKGIQPEFLPHVFERFRQADGTTTRLFGGLGLGLAIVRHLVELHGGTVQATSAGIGKGATFTIKLPLTPSAQSIKTEINGSSTRKDIVNTKTPESLTGSLKGLKILVVDDEIGTLEMLKVMLESSGASVITARSVSEALENLKTNVPDLIISDIGMPGTDGYEFIENVRRMSPENGGNTPAVALTAYARHEDKQKALRSGFQMHLTKPIEIDSLVSTIAGLLERV